MEWGPFFDQYRAMALRALTGWGVDDSTREDLFQEAASALIEREASGAVCFESSAHARNYLFRVLHNLAFDARRPAREVSIENAVTDAVDTGACDASERRFEHTERAPAIERALGQLKPAEREVIRLRFEARLTYREIQEREGVAISTLQARLESALKKLRRILGKRLTEE